ncbi:hypothetical protein HKD37_15G043914 [Glycine soja]
MIRTRDLGRALGMVIERALWREVSCDADDAPQQQRPTASTRRQQEVALITKDVHDMDHANDEVHE